MTKSMLYIWRRRLVQAAVWIIGSVVAVVFIVCLIWQAYPEAILAIYNRANVAPGRGDGQPIIDRFKPEYLERGPMPICFKHFELDDQYHTEGASVADIDRDGHNDILTPDFWYRAPDWERRRIRIPDYTPLQTLRPTDILGMMRNHGRQMLAYADQGFLSFLAAGGLFQRAWPSGYFAFPSDVNRDGWVDLIVASFPGTPASWYQNPGPRTGLWLGQNYLPFAGHEAPLFTEVLARGKPQLLINAPTQLHGDGPLILLSFDEEGRPTKEALSDDIVFQSHAHGLGVGDINGDGLLDIAFGSGRIEDLSVKPGKAQPGGGWYEQRVVDGQRRWLLHRIPTLIGAAEIQVLDVSGDGKADLVAGSAHDAGLFWFEQGEGELWTPHVIDASYAQLHALAMADLDGDGLNDLITGKTALAHFGLMDPGEFEPDVLYWYRQIRDRSGRASFVRYLIDDQVGTGRQVTLADVDGDSRQDIVIGNRNGVHLFMQTLHCEQVSP